MSRVALCPHHASVLATRTRAQANAVRYRDGGRKALNLLALQLARACPSCPDPRSNHR